MPRSRRRVLPSMLTVSVAVLLAPAPARAQEGGAERHAWLAYAGLGLAVGSAAGLSTSYLLERDGHGFARRPLTYGTGVGALSGLALGLTLGLVDHVGERQEGLGALVTAALFAAVGALFGGVENFTRDALGKAPFGDHDGEALDPDAFPVGAAAGAVFGVGGAVVFALIAISVPEESPRRFSLALTLAPATGTRPWLPVLVGRF